MTDPDDDEIARLADEAEAGFEPHQLQARQGFTCAHCGATSYNRHDVDNRYCGACHHFCEDIR